MTAQASEILFYKGLKYEITTEPLTEFLKNNSKSFHSTNTGCWRGYIGNWEIRENKLFLISLDGNSDNAEVGLEYLFPNQKEVFANWFNGELTMPRGKMVKYVNPMHLSVYEKNIVFNFSNGIIKNQIIKDNRTGEIKEIIFKDILDLDVKEKINNSTLYELIEMFNKVLKPFSSTTKNINLEETNKLYTKIDISNWNAADKEVLLTNILKALNIYYYVLSDMKSVPIGSFNSVIKAISGEEFIYANKKSIKWFSKNIKDKINKQGIDFEDFRQENKYSNYSNSYEYDDSNWLADAAGTDDPEIMNDVYWNLD